MDFDESKSSGEVEDLQKPFEPARASEPQVELARKPVRRPRAGGWRVFRRTIVAILLLGLVGAIGYGAYAAINVAKISTNPYSLEGLSTDSNGRTNILILGVGDPGHAGEGLSDTMMVLSIDTHTKRVAQISIPRDLRVD